MLIPRIYKLKKSHKDYKYGFRWAVSQGKSTRVIVRTFKRAFKYWWRILRGKSLL